VRKLILAIALCLTSTCTVVILSGASDSATATSATTAGAGSFTKTETITRDNVVNGSDVVVDSRTVTLNVSQTTNLQGRQEIGVTWSGAHPTGGIVADQNSIEAQYEEYPFVLLECRGVDSTSVSSADQLSPQTCWTQSWEERYQDSLDDAYPPYRLDQDATSAETAPIVGAPQASRPRVNTTSQPRCSIGFLLSLPVGWSIPVAMPDVPVKRPNRTMLEVRVFRATRHSE